MSTPLCNAIVSWALAEHAKSRAMPLLMVSGAQGIGKSTAMDVLAARSDIRAVVLGLDDFYLPKADRERLGAEIHPLCQTRGPPGTHDVALLGDVIDQLTNGPQGVAVRVPRFDKRRDERRLLSDWPQQQARPDLIVLEGWMTGVLSDRAVMNRAPINSLERDEDPNGIWRVWQEESLEALYDPIWDRGQAFLHLRAPSFDIVTSWRVEQEETTLGLAPGTLPPERKMWVARFVQHYERLTRRMLAGRLYPGTVIKVDNARHPA